MSPDTEHRRDGGRSPAEKAVRRLADSARRSVAKTVSWRIVGSVDTLILSFAILSVLGPVLGMEPATHGENARTASAIALTEIVTKILLYYLHERVWARSRWHIVARDDGRNRATATRSFAKATTWRVAASLDTTLLALVFTGSAGAALTIGTTEAITKVGLYYVHERIWERVRWGTAV